MELSEIICILARDLRETGIIMIDFSKFNNIISLTTYFSSDKKSKQTIIESRWTDENIVCPYCGKHQCLSRTDGKFCCKACWKNFSCLVLTIFMLQIENSENVY